MERLQPSLARLRVKITGATADVVLPALVVNRDGLLIAPTLPALSPDTVNLTATYWEKGPSGFTERKDAPATWVASAWWGGELVRVQPTGELAPVEVAQEMPAAGSMLRVWGLSGADSPSVLPERFGVFTVGLQENCALDREPFDRWVAQLGPANYRLFVFTSSGALAGISWFFSENADPHAARDPDAPHGWKMEDPIQLRDLLTKQANGYPLRQEVREAQELPPYDASMGIPVGKDVVAVDTFADGSLLVVRGGDRVSPVECEFSIYPIGQKRATARMPRGVMRFLGMEMDRTSDQAYVLLAPAEAKLAPTLVRIDSRGVTRDIALRKPSVAFALCPERGRAIVMEESDSAPTLLFLALETGETATLALPASAIGLLAEDPSRVASTRTACFPDGSMAMVVPTMIGATYKLVLMAFPTPGRGDQGAMEALGILDVSTRVVPWSCLTILDRTSGDLVVGDVAILRQANSFDRSREFVRPQWEESTLARISAYFGEHPEPDRSSDDFVLAISKDGSRVLSRLAVRERSSLSCLRLTDVWGPCGAFSPDGETAYVYDQRAGVLVPIQVPR